MLMFLKEIWLRFAEAVEWLTTRGILMILYVFAVGAYAVIGFVVRKIIRPTVSDSTWEPYLHQPMSLEELEREF